LIHLLANELPHSTLPAGGAKGAFGDEDSDADYAD
jgi:hypothetical protein